MTETLRVAVDQMAPSFADPDANRRRMEASAASRPGMDLLVFPELSLTGYALEERAQDLAVPVLPPPIALSADSPPVAFGFVERGRNQLVYNAAALLDGESLVALHRKVYLPTYGIFDEGRTFAPGQSGARSFELRETGWRAGLLVCEDLWHPALPYLLALQEIDLLVVLSAAPGRGEPEDPVLHPYFGSAAPWELVARSTALLHGIFVVVANRVGTEGNLTFAGGSLVVDPRGEVVARAPQAEEAVVEVVLERNSIRDARAAFSHLRDENPGFVHRELERLLFGRRDETR